MNRFIFIHSHEFLFMAFMIFHEFEKSQDPSRTTTIFKLYGPRLRSRGQKKTFQAIKLNLSLQNVPVMFFNNNLFKTTNLEVLLLKLFL